MKKLIIVRHGDYDSHGNLNSLGISQMERVLVDISNKITLGACTIKILSSSAPRAQQSAEILSEGLGVCMETDICLWSDGNHKWNPIIATDFILLKSSECHAEVIIVVTHLEYCEDLPSLIYKRITGGEAFSCTSLGKGQKLVMDFN